MELVLTAITIVAILSFFSAAISDRKAAKKAGEPTGSLLWHFKQHTAKEQARKKELKASKLAERQLKKDAHKQPPATTTPPPLQPTKPARPTPSSTAKPLKFTYEDFNGDITYREITNWKEEGDYIKGFCLDRRDARTFRKERIIAFSEGEHLLRGARKASNSYTPPPISKPATIDKPMEILFTGFPKDKRAELEAQAAEEGMIVRTRVTKALDFLCIGPKAAPSKQAEAEHRGATVLDEMAFYDLLESGELPDR